VVFHNTGSHVLSKRFVCGLLQAFDEKPLAACNLIAHVGVVKRCYRHALFNEAIAGIDTMRVCNLLGSSFYRQRSCFVHNHVWNDVVRVRGSVNHIAGGAGSGAG